MVYLVHKLLLVVVLALVYFLFRLQRMTLIWIPLTDIILAVFKQIAVDIVLMRVKAEGRVFCGGQVL